MVVDTLLPTRADHSQKPFALGFASLNSGYLGGNLEYIYSMCLFLWTSHFCLFWFLHVLECDWWRPLWAVQLYGAQQAEERLWRAGPNPTRSVQEAWGYSDPLRFLSPFFTRGACWRSFCFHHHHLASATWQEKGAVIIKTEALQPLALPSVLPLEWLVPCKIGSEVGSLLPAHTQCIASGSSLEHNTPYSQSHPCIPISGSCLLLYTLGFPVNSFVQWYFVMEAS